MPSFAIHSRRVVTPDGVKPAYVLIKDTLIDEVTGSLPEGYTGELFQAGDNILMPGIIDPHVHINEPGRTEWEGFDTATKAAVAGGITALVDMPLNSVPVTTSVKAFEEKINAAKNKLHAHCGFWGGLIPGNTHEIEPLIEKGVLGFKAFLIHSGIDEFPNVTEADLRSAMPLIAKHGLPLLVHCELKSGEWRVRDGERHYDSYLQSRPRKWEDDAIALMIRLCEEFNCRVHIVHLSSSDSIEQIARAKEKGLPLTVETCPHYLYFHAEEINDGQTQFKCAPPIREKENNEKLWQALKEGIIDYVATDHSPAPPELKLSQHGDFSKAWGGIASLQFALPALWTAARKRNGTISDLAKWLCENPAKIIGKENSKGKIAKGFDADLLIWDDQKSFVVSEDMILHRHKTTPYLGETLLGVTEQTYLAGEKVFDNGMMRKNKGKVMLACRSLEESMSNE
jgi:allantoinase